ncbi:bifunctional diacylglycerol diphosphate phosphatase/phosphatidate phosphatase [Bulinus truncatus]|nr:bifunctional diacylglycerol diphosphate phosphatase/phosphatidate phosphatase [Bulinus truncatus]
MIHPPWIMGISPYNTRLIKEENALTGEVKYEVKLAAVNTSELGKEVNFTITRGDFSPLLAFVVNELKNAQVHVANNLEKDTLGEYIRSFSSGSILSHKEGSRFWIKNKEPIVETYIGFIESYRDPFGVRGEFEGFVAVVNKAMSAKFKDLVNNAEHLLAHLPWPGYYEKDKFLKPDFTSLDVLAFGGSGIPAGINIPNYDDIRQNEGFKNVSLGNVLTSRYKESKVTFLKEEDKELYTKYSIQSFEVQVGLHELLGHGSGKLFREEEPGKFNFNKDAVLHTETNQKITSWYKANETWDSKFSTIASTYEECRAECVGIYLCLHSKVLSIFGHIDEEADNIIYINWLNMVRAGLLALEFYSPETNSWKQAHMNARYVILRVLLEAGEGFVKIEKLLGEDNKPDLCVPLDKFKISSIGKPAIGAFLRKLQVYKSTADVQAATKMYKRYSEVNDCAEPKFLSMRKIVIDRKEPRKLLVQQHTFLKDGVVRLKTYEPSASGLIQSFVDRFPTNDIDAVINHLWAKEMTFY